MAVTENSTNSVCPDTGLSCLVMLARFFGVPADLDQLRHQYGRADRQVNVIELLRCAKSLGLKAKRISTKWQRLTRTPLPAIAEYKDGRFLVLAKADGEKALIHDPFAQRLSTLTKEAFETLWTGRLILLVDRAHLVGHLRPFDSTWFIPSIVKYRKLFGEVLMASFFVQIFALATPLFFQVIIDKVLVHRGFTSLDVLVFGLLVISAFDALLGGLRTYIFSHTTSRIDVELGARLFRHLLGLPIAYFDVRRVGDTVARVRELDSVREFLTGSALTVVLDLFFTFVFLIVMYVYSPVLTYVVIASFPFYVALSWIITPVLRNRLSEKFNRGAENQAFLVESITGVETVKAMAVEPQMLRQWEGQIAAYVHSAFRAKNLSNIASQFAGLINKVVVALILWFGAHMVISGEMTVGQLVAFNMLAARVSQPVLRMAQLWQEFQQFRISIQRLGDILNTKTEPVIRHGQTSLPKILGRITLENATFRYLPDGPEVVRQLSLDIPPGQVVGIVGSSGSGKSTLTKLIQRLYVPESGRVLIDGVDLAMVDPSWLRRQIGVVLQENYLFNRSVRDNIALADPGLDMGRIVAAAKMAGAHEFILELPQAYDSIIGERGSTLSGGQRQRMAIARALVTDPQILIFDEATSALDYESERAIQDNMREICQGRTVLIVAHRLAAIRNTDRIITVEKGEIIEDGTHGELLRKGGRYATLYRHQVGEDVVAG